MTPTIRFSIGLLQLFAEADVPAAQQKKSDNDRDKYKIAHGISMLADLSRS
jgi:hypothetical protein